MNIGIIGLGYVGLTFAALAAYKDVNIVALEKNQDIKNSLRNKKAHFFEPGLDDMLESLIEKKIIVKDSFGIEDKNVDGFFITVGTPLIENSKKPNYDHLFSALDSFKHIYDGSQLVILRSTVSVGTTRKIVIPYLSKISGISEKDVLVAFCPERTVEGKAVVELQELPQIISANNKESFEISENLFRRITNTVIKIEPLEAGELIKLFNNTYRDIHFAVGNIFNEIAQGYGINGNDIIKVSNSGYSRSNIAFPGFVGGPCLEKDAYILTENMKNSPGKEFVLNSRKYNESLESKVVDWIKNNLKASNKICISGLAFKGIPETSDLRGSSSINIVKKLNSMGYYPKLHDFAAYKDEVEYSLKGDFSNDLYSACNNCEALIILNNHAKYSKINVDKIINSMANTKLIILDHWSSLNKISIEMRKEIIYKNSGNLLI